MKKVRGYRVARPKLKGNFLSLGFCFLFQIGLGLRVQLSLEFKMMIKISLGGRLGLIWLKINISNFFIEKTLK